MISLNPHLLFKIFFMALLLDFMITRPAFADIVIGYTGPVSGTNASQGDDEERGVSEAVKEINSRNDFYGEKIVLDTEADACDPRQTLTIANRFASNGVKFVIGAACPSSTLVTAKILNAQHILMISSNTMDASLTSSGYKTIFRICGRSDQQGVVQAQYVIKNFRNYRLAILYDNSHETHEQAETFQKTLNAAGVKEAVMESYTPNAKDYSNIISTINNQNGIQLLIVDGNYKDIALMAKAVKAQRANIQIMGDSNLANEKFLKAAGDASEGVMMTYEAVPPVQSSDSSLATNSGANDYSLYSYAALEVIMESIKLAGYPDPTKAAAALRKNTFDTALGKISFDENGDVIGSGYAIYRWHGGKYEEIGG